MDKNKDRDITFGITLVIIILIALLSGCAGTYYITDSEYSDLREEHSSVTYYDNQIYWGWNEGFYYYYGMPHYYPWYIYYNSCPPSHYTHTTHVIITRPVNRPTHRPNRPTINRPRGNDNRIYIKPNKNHNIRVTPNRNTKVKVTPNRNTKVKTNKTNTRPNNKVKTNRRPR